MSSQAGSPGTEPSLGKRSWAEEGLAVYQVRTFPAEGPEDMVEGLTWAVWKVLEEAGAGPDPHFWPDLLEEMRGVFKERLMRHESCGRLQRCRIGPEKVFWPEKEGPLPPVVHLLRCRGNVEGLEQMIVDLLRRWFPFAFPDSIEARVKMELRLTWGIRRALAENLYYSPSCQECELPQERGDRRFWGRRS